MKYYINITILLTLLLACSEDSVSPPPDSYNFKGTVKDINGNLLNDVSVFLIFDFDFTSKKVQVITNPSDVIITAFTGYVSVGKVFLNWSTSSEVNNSGFEIQRKQANHSEFLALGFVAGRGTTNEVQNYSFTDANFNVGTYKYRLKQINFDGSFNYSNEIEVEITAPPETAFYQNYPNPFQVNTNLNYTLTNDSEVEIVGHSFFANDSIVLIERSQKFAGHHELNTNHFSSLPNNLYKITFKAKHGTITYFKDILVFKNYSNIDSMYLKDRPYTKTNNGEFIVNYSKMPFNKTFQSTDIGSPAIISDLIVLPRLTIVLSKSGYKTSVSTFDLNTTINTDKMFVLQFN